MTTPAPAWTAHPPVEGALTGTQPIAQSRPRDPAVSGDEPQVTLAHSFAGGTGDIAPMVPVNPAAPAAPNYATFQVPVPPELWARDHFTTVAYLQHTMRQDGWLRPSSEKMRQRPGTPRRGMDSPLSPGWSTSAGYPTRLKGGVKLDPLAHDDWSCLDDAEAIGILVSGGTGLHPAYKLTGEGRKVVGWLCNYIDTRDNGAGANTMLLEWSRVVTDSGFDAAKALEQAVELRRELGL